MGGMGYDALLRRSVLQTCGCFDLFPSYPICFDILAHSFAPLKMLTPLFSSTTALFGKNNRGWGTPSEKHASVFGRSQRGFFCCATPETAKSRHYQCICFNKLNHQVINPPSCCILGNEEK